MKSDKNNAKKLFLALRSQLPDFSRRLPKLGFLKSDLANKSAEIHKNDSSTKCTFILQRRDL